MSPELHLAVEAEERVRKEKEELLKAMAHQRRHFCTMEEKAEKRNQQLKELERSIEWKKQECQAMMADIAEDSRRRKEREDRRYAERLGIDENGNLVDSEEESYMEACAAVAAQAAEADPPGTPRRRPEEEEEEVPGSPSSTYSFVDDGNPFRHGAYLDDT